MTNTETTGVDVAELQKQVNRLERRLAETRKQNATLVQIVEASQLPALNGLTVDEYAETMAARAEAEKQS